MSNNTYIVTFVLLWMCWMCMSEPVYFTPILQYVKATCEISHDPDPLLFKTCDTNNINQVLTF